LSDSVRVARLRVGLGVAQWSPDEAHILIKRAVERKSGELVVVAVPTLVAPPKGQEAPVHEPEMRPLLHGLAIRDFAVSPDGRFMGIAPPGKRNLQVYAFPPL